MTDFDRAYRENAELVYRYVFSLTRNADLAEEVTQQTFYEAIRHPGNYRGEAALSTYLCGIAGNLMKKELSRRARENHVPIEEMTDLPEEGSAEDAAMGNLSRQELFRRIHALPEKTREVVYLRLSGELPFSEIGAILGESETWARVTFYRAKQKLLEAEFFEAAPLAAAAGGRFVRGGDAAVPGRAVSAGILL